MRYAVATHAQLIALEVDNNWQVINSRRICSAPFYGLATNRHDPDRLFAGVHADRSRILVFRRTPPHTRIDSLRLDAELGDLHQIACANGVFYIVNTKYNSLMYSDDGGNLQHEYVFDNIRSDVNHANSVFPCGRNIYVLLHNKGRRESELIQLDHHLQSGFSMTYRLRLPDIGCHNIFIENDRLYYNASLAGNFVVYDLRSGRCIKRLILPGHLKGMSLVEGKFVIGFSQPSSRGLRSFSKGCLAVIDKRCLQLEAVIDVNGEASRNHIGNINDIRCLSNEDLACKGDAMVDLRGSHVTPGKSHARLRIETKLRELIRAVRYPRYWSKV